MLQAAEETAGLPLAIPKKYKDWVKEFHSTISFDQLAKKGEALPVQLLKV